MMLPTANVVMPIGSIMAERFLYLPSAGFCVVAAQGLLWAGGALGRRMKEARGRVVITWLLPVVVAAGFAGRAYVRNADWHDELSLWKSAMAATPESFKAHKGYANALATAGQDEAAVDAAIAQDEAARAILEQKPLPPERQDNTLYQDLGLYYRTKGALLEQRGRAAEAREFFNKSVAVLERARVVDRWVNEASREKSLRSGWAAGDIRDVGNHRVYLQLGLSALAAGNYTEAESAGRWMQHIAPQEAMAYQITGAAQYDLGRQREAAVQFLEGLVLDPNDAEAWGDLQKCFTTLGAPGAVTPASGGGYQLNGSSAEVQEALKEAFVALVNGFEEAKRSDDAQQLRDLAEKRYGMPAEVFSPPAK
jgi:tetratricopeptide (TPR) repeat protein